MFLGPELVHGNLILHRAFKMNVLKQESAPGSENTAGLAFFSSFRKGAPFSHSLSWDMVQK